MNFMLTGVLPMNSVEPRPHPEESSQNTCDFGEIRKYISPFTMVVYEKTDFEA